MRRTGGWCLATPVALMRLLLLLLLVVVVVMVMELVSHASDTVDVTATLQAPYSEYLNGRRQSRHGCIQYLTTSHIHVCL